VPHRGGDGFEGRRLAGRREPAPRVEVEALAGEGGGGPQGLGQRRQHLALGGREGGAEAELRRRPREPRQQHRLGLRLGEPREARAVPAENAAAPAGPAHAVDRDPRGAEGLEIAVDGAHRDAELDREGLGRHWVPASLEEQQEREQAAGSHAPRV